MKLGIPLLFYMIYLAVLGFGCADVAGRGSNAQQVQCGSRWLTGRNTESSATYVVKKTQLWGVQSFLFPLLWLFAPDADLLLSLFVLGAWTLRTWTFVLIISNKYCLRTRPQLGNASVPFFFNISSLSNEVHGQKLWDKSSWCCVSGSCKRDEKGWEHFRIIYNNSY